MFGSIAAQVIATVQEKQKARYTFCSPVSFIANDLRQWICTKLNSGLPSYEETEMEMD